MCSFASFIGRENPETGEFEYKVWDLMSHGLTREHFGIKDSVLYSRHNWIDMHYYPDGSIDDRGTGLRGRIKETWPTFTSFMQYAINHIDPNTKTKIEIEYGYLFSDRKITPGEATGLLVDLATSRKLSPDIANRLLGGGADPNVLLGYSNVSLPQSVLRRIIEHPSFDYSSVERPWMAFKPPVARLLAKELDELDSYVFVGLAGSAVGRKLLRNPEIVKKFSPKLDKLRVGHYIPLNAVVLAEYFTVLDCELPAIEHRIAEILNKGLWVYDQECMREAVLYGRRPADPVDFIASAAWAYCNFKTTGGLWAAKHLGLKDKSGRAMERMVVNDHVGAAEQLIVLGLYDPKGNKSFPLGRCRSIEMARVLIKHGVPINAKCKGITAVEMQAKAKNYKVVSFLLEHGAKDDGALAKLCRKKGYTYLKGIVNKFGITA